MTVPQHSGSSSCAVPVATKTTNSSPTQRQVADAPAQAKALAMPTLFQNRGKPTLLTQPRKKRVALETSEHYRGREKLLAENNAGTIAPFCALESSRNRVMVFPTNVMTGHCRQHTLIERLCLIRLALANNLLFGNNLVWNYEDEFPSSYRGM